MSKDAIIDVPCLKLDLTPKAPGAEIKLGPELKMHFVPVPEAALAEVQAVLKKYEAEFAEFNAVVKKAQNKEN